MSATPADTWAEAIAIVESEPEYPDADEYFGEVKDALAECQFEHPELVFKMLVQVARDACQETKRCIAERMHQAAGIERANAEEAGE